MTAPSRVRLALLTVAAGAAALAPAGVVPAPAHAAPPGITVIQNEVEVVKFDKAKCRVTKNGKKFTAEAKSHGWKLEIVLRKFSGYRTYDVEYGFGSTANFRILNPGGTAYSNIYVPSFPFPAVGAVTFPGGKKGRVGLGFVAAFSSAGALDGSDGVAVGGQATCKYPKK